MSKNAIIEINGNKFELPVMVGSENETAIDNFLNENNFGKKLAKGWHTRLLFMRQWGKITEFEIPKENIELELIQALGYFFANHSSTV